MSSFLGAWAFSQNKQVTWKRREFTARLFLSHSLCVCVCVCVCVCAYVQACVYFQAAQPAQTYMYWKLHTYTETQKPLISSQLTIHTNSTLIKRQTQKPLTASQLTTKTNTRFRLMWWIKETDVWCDLDSCWNQVRCLCELMEHSWPWVLSVPINTSSHTSH